MSEATFYVCDTAHVKNWVDSIGSHVRKKLQVGLLVDSELSLPMVEFCERKSEAT
jgi:hypothetical protein